MWRMIEPRMRSDLTEAQKKECRLRSLDRHSKHFWLEGCVAPIAKGCKANISPQSGAQPCKATPWVLSVYDQAGIAHHIEENADAGKMVQLGPAKDKIPE